MTTASIAEHFVTLCRAGQYEQVYAELYDSNASSIEPAENAFGLGTIVGLDKFKEKADLFNSLVEAFHSSHIGDPCVAGDYFAVQMRMEADFKGMGRINLDELCVYHVQNGKIVSEQFFY